MFGQIEEMQKNLQAKLDTITVEAQAGDGLVKVKANANRKILNIELAPSLLGGDDIEEVEDLVLTAVNRVLDMAEVKAGEESKNLLSGMLPPGMNIPGMF